MKKLVVFFLILGSISFGVEKINSNQGVAPGEKSQKETEEKMMEGFLGRSFLSKGDSSNENISLSKSFVKKLMPRTKNTNKHGSKDLSGLSLGDSSTERLIMPPTNIMVGALVVEPYPGLKNN